MGEAARNFVAAEDIQAVRQPATPRLKSLNGAQYCDFLISAGSPRVAVERGREIVERLGEADNTVISKAICNVVLARALMTSDTSSVEEADGLLKNASAVLRAAGQKQELALALISRAAFLSSVSSVDRNELKSAATEAYQIARRSGSDVLLIEAGNARHKLYLADGDAASAEQSAAEVSIFRSKTGYGRPSICGVW
jgi:hypothetical protein